MTDDPKDPPDETPMQRALRLKKAAQQARPQAPGGGKPRAQAGVTAGASRPWMKR
jgi:hypothetical protein